MKNHILVKTKRSPVKGYAGLTVWPYIFIKESSFDEYLYNHEKIHVKQILELWVIGFYVLYLYYYMKNRIIHRMNHYLAYRHIPFEWEAYKMQENRLYLTYRQKYAWKMYVIYKGGTEQKSRLLKSVYPKQVELVMRYGRHHHRVDFSRYKKNILIRKSK